MPQLEVRFQLHPRGGRGIATGALAATRLLGSSLVTLWTMQAPFAMRQTAGRGMLCPAMIGMEMLLQHGAQPIQQSPVKAMPASCITGFESGTTGERGRGSGKSFLGCMFPCQRPGMDPALLRCRFGFHLPLHSRACQHHTGRATAPSTATRTRNAAQICSLLIPSSTCSLSTSPSSK